ncbi:hypothetical protein VC83_08001 [Pseudogymnoascus destructans]|uniref:Uncharacterized protein n=2 Tax=Pseudogymnoascus destructans TaxID=655981 RepID=L8FTC4_PSED2|nr:uncharacterized protein VC83_08001 [Pseudogymnoascus destructans]ELR04210.1 hypothetical protein GMDG_06625 [Pseudogymnoascus destructans 20631-21]OAF55936.1 hypothetical protein VC83_08001 [Pseudogymnoascus destructans]
MDPNNLPPNIESVSAAFNRIAEDVNTINEEIPRLANIEPIQQAGQIQTTLAQHSQLFQRILDRLDQQSNNFQETSRRLTVIESTLDQQSRRLTVIESTLDQQSRRLTIIESTLDQLANNFQETSRRLTAIENTQIRNSNSQRLHYDSLAIISPLLDPETGVAIRNCPNTIAAIYTLSAHRATRILGILQVPIPASLEAKREAVRFQFI